jgi:hypothetical protein
LSADTQLRSSPKLNPGQKEPVDHADNRALQERNQQLKQIAWLGACSAIIVAAFLLRVQGTNDVAFMGVTVPQSCNMKRFTGLDCPGCGLTRSFVSMAHGDWRTAWNFHAAGPIWFVVVVAQIPLRLWQLFRIRRGKCELRTGLEWPFLIGMFGLLLVVWIYKMLLG